MNQPSKNYEYLLTDTGKRGKLITRDGFAVCPKCGKTKLIRMSPGTCMQDAGIFCKRCGNVNLTIMSAP